MINVKSLCFPFAAAEQKRKEKKRKKKRSECGRFPLLLEGVSAGGWFWQQWAVHGKPREVWGRRAIIIGVVREIGGG